MKNKKGKSFLGMLLLLIAIGVFGYFGYSTMNQIKLGLDLAGGVSITYQAKEENPSSEDMADTASESSLSEYAIHKFLLSITISFNVMVIPSLEMLFPTTFV